MERYALAKVALGKEAADLVICGGKLVNVCTKEVYDADVAIKGDSIAYIGDCTHTIDENTEIIDAKGKYICPGLIDQHVHTYESQMDVVEYANAVVPLGVTGVVNDFYGECVIGGIKAIRSSLDIAKKQTPLKIFFALPMPAYYQNLPFYHVGHPTEEEMIEMMDWEECVGLNDTFGSKMIANDPKMQRLIDEAQKRRLEVCGHGSELSEKQSNAWMAYVRRTDDHECTQPEELLYKLRMGMYVSMRVGSGCVEIPRLAKALSYADVDTRHITLNTDVCSPLRMSEEGHLDNCVRTCIKNGIHPIDAICMATINTAECIRKDDLFGSVAPGKIADIVLVKDLVDFRADTVIANGRVVAKDGKLLAPFKRAPYPEYAYNTVRLKREIRASDFAISCNSNTAQKVRAIGCSNEGIITTEIHTEIVPEDGFIRPDTERDILKIASLERTKLSGDMYTALIHGFGLKSGAIASTYNPHNQHMTIVGTNDEDMAFAANKLVEMGGGFIVVEKGEVKAALPLPMYGLLSDMPLESVVEGVRSVYSASWDIGCVLSEPFHTLAFVGLPVIIGNLKISPTGLVDVWAEKNVPLFIEEA
ncbi:MAG: hypothetical protein DBX58_03715 [Clostridiales bacterium]|nr:MAG: hypothetical protein DBX58_03715 [Clostridiales bacterium]